jgi:hypothetical protein
MEICRKLVQFLLETLSILELLEGFLRDEGSI